MQLVEQHIVKKNSSAYAELDEACFRSKNLYNAALYAVRQHYFETGKYLSYESLAKKFVVENNVDYRSLPANVSQQVLKLVDKSFKSFFGSLKSKNVKNAKLPKYLEKNGRQVATYTARVVSQKLLLEGKIKLSQINRVFDTRQTNVCQVRLVPKNQYIVIDVIYDVPDIVAVPDNGNYLGVDMGVNNLMTVAGNRLSPVIIDGKKLKSINQYYNKKLAHYKSKLKGNAKTSKRIQKLTNKRNNKVKDYLHKASRILVNHAVSNDVSIVVIGKNDGWKQEVKIGKANNQNFVQIPHARLINMVSYKLEMVGIPTKLQQESHTSKCSFLDDEQVRHQEKYVGRRIKRGLFRSESGKMINADVNGALNILRKCIPNVVYDNGKEAIVVSPSVLTVK
jgi:putative transposase